MILKQNTDPSISYKQIRTVTPTFMGQTEIGGKRLHQSVCGNFAKFIKKKKVCTTRRKKMFLGVLVNRETKQIGETKRKPTNLQSSKFICLQSPSMEHTENHNKQKAKQLTHTEHKVQSP